VPKPKTTILVVEDDPDTLKIITSVLSRGGFHVLSAADGHEALEKARTHRPAAILSDMILPGLDGTELCMRLKTHRSTRDIPIGFLTARSDTEAFRQVLGQGAVLYMTKPFPPEKLLALVNLLVGTKASSEGSGNRQRLRKPES